MPTVNKPFWFGLASSFLLTFALCWWLYQFYAFPLTIPRGYMGDAYFSAMVIKQTITQPWSNTQPLLGYPFGQNLSDFPAADVVNTLFVYGMSFITSDPWVISNLFLISSFLLCAISAYFVFYQLKFPLFACILGSVLFSFLPYHLIRGPYHLYLANYWIVPLVCWYCLQLFNHKEKKQFQISDIFYAIGLGILIGGSGLYYAVFSLILVALALVFSSIRTFMKVRSIYTLLLILTTLLTVVLQFWPTVSHNYTWGANPIVGERHGYEADNNSLQLIRLLMPLEPMGVSALLPYVFNADQPLNDMEKRQFLGIPGLIGLAIIFIKLWFAPPKKENHARWWALGILCATIYLVAMPGGVGTIIAYLISPQIRAYGRILPFFGFFTLTGLLLFIDELTQQKKWRLLSITILLLIGGWLHQVAWFQVPVHKIAASYQSDKIFFTQIADLQPQAIYQLPYKAFPETPPVHQLSDYDLLKGYLLTQSPTAWSYASIKGRQGDQWFAGVNQFPVEVQLQIAKGQGFSGILIDRFGYEDGGRAVESSLSALLVNPPIMSQDRRLIYYEL